MIDHTYYAECAYPGYARFYFGTVVADGYEHARIEIEKALHLIVPTLPEIVNVFPGEIVVHRRPSRGAD